MESKRMSTGVVVLITTLVIALIGTISFIVYDKVIKKAEVKEPITNEENNEIKEPVTNEENKPSNEVVTGKIIVEEKNNMLYVNNNKIDFYSVSDAAKKYDYTSEDDFYNRDSAGAGYIYYIIGDVVFVRFSASGEAFSDELYFVDNNGKIIKKINGENADMILSRNTDIIDSVEVRRNFLSVYFIIKNSDVAMGSEAAICDRFAKGEENEIAVYVDRIAYLGNGEFKLYKAVETMTYEQYAETQRGFNIDYCFMG